ncbi:MAG: DUF3137 domain-containing protein [Candidatus Omnitrophota bacterium]
MKTREDLKSFFDVVLSPGLKELEKKRLKVLNSVILVEAGVLAVTLLVAGLVYNSGGGEPLLSVLFIGVLVMAGLFAVLTHSFRSPFKETVIRPLVRFFDESLSYTPDGCISCDLYTCSKLFLHHVDEYRGDDLVEGMIGKTRVKFSELHTQYKVETRDSKGRRQTQWHTIFKGLFFIADFNKNFSGRTVVLPDQAERCLGGFGKFLQSKNVSRDPLVSMDDPGFEKEFVVYGTDQIEARYILTSSLMSRVMNFRRKTGRNLYLSFIDSAIFIAIPYAKNLFEPNIFRTLLDFKPVEEYFNDLNTALSIVEELNLNTRIWSKV